MTNIKHSILHINTDGISGGAGKAAYRLHKGLLSIGRNSQYLVKEIQTTDPTIFVAPADAHFERHLVNDELINKHYIWYNRTAVTNTYFSFSYPGYDLSKNSLILDADILNLHWTEDFLSPRSLNALFSMNKPAVWTLHDQKPFTGGCHYSAGCKKYQELCQRCPQLSEDPIGLPSAILRDKMELFKGADLTIVTPSQWLAKEARKSNLFKSNRVEVIPNSLETDIYYPVDKETAKKLLDIDPNTITIMFGSADISDERKGIRHLIAATYFCLKDARFKKLIDSRKLVFICVGKADELTGQMPVPLMNMGYIDDDRSMAGIYNAADMFILPSVEDNLPNTMIEAMACGAPVISFKAGGMPDVIIDDLNGKLADFRDDEQLGRAILDLVFNPDKRAFLNSNCSLLIREKYKLEDQANNYLRLYDELLKDRGERKTTVIPYGGTYGRNTRIIYGGLFRFAVKKVLKKKFNVEVNNEFALSVLGCGLRFMRKVIPNHLNYFFRQCERIYHSLHIDNRKR